MAASLKELADALGITRRQLDRLLDQGVVPATMVETAASGRRKILDLEGAVEAVRAFESPPDLPDELPMVEGLLDILDMPDDQVPDFAISRARREHYAAELARLKCLEASDLWMETEVHTRQMVGLCVLARTRLEQLPAQVAPELAAESSVGKVEMALERHVRAVLREMVERLMRDAGLTEADLRAAGHLPAVG